MSGPQRLPSMHMQRVTCLAPWLQVGETYDWRLSVANMERRDKYFSRLRARIELLHSTQGEKVRR